MSARALMVLGTASHVGKSILTAEGRKRLSEMMKKRWAERRKKLAVVRKATKKVA